jgi:hypothetical protein
MKPIQNSKFKMPIAVGAVILLIFSFFILNCQAQPAPAPSETAALAFPFTIVTTGQASNILGTAVAVGNLGVWTPAAAYNVPRAPLGLNVQITWGYAAVTNGVAQTGFFLQGSTDGTNYDNDFNRLIAIIHPAATVSTNVLVTSTNLSETLIQQYQKLRWAAVTNGGQPTASNFVGRITRLK